MKNNNKFVTCHLVAIFLLLVAANLFFPFIGFAAAQSPLAEELENKRELFYSKKNELILEQNVEKQQLLQKIETLKLRQLNFDNETTEINRSISEFQSINLVAKAFANFFRLILFPILLSAVFLGSNSIIYFVFIVTVINCVLFLYKQERDFFLKKKKLIIGIATILILLFVSPTLVQASEGTEELLDKIAETERIMKLSPLKREIRYLEFWEGAQGQGIEVPIINIENVYLKPLEYVQIGEWGYHYTLAALYLEDGRPGLAIDSLNKMFAKFGGTITNVQVEYAIKSIKFLLKKHQIESASQALDKLIPGINETDKLLDLYEYLEQMRMDNSAKQALNRVINIAQNEKELLKLSQFFIDQGNPYEAAQAIKKAISKTRSKVQLIELIKYSAENKMENALDQGIDKTVEISIPLEDYFELVDYILQQQRVEQASNMLSIAINNISRNAENFTEKMLLAANMASKRGMHIQAIHALERLSSYLKAGASNFRVPLSLLPFEKGNVPADEDISLPVYYGILQQKSGYTDKAETSYRLAAMRALNQMQVNFNLEKSLNDFFYLRELYKGKGDYKTLQKLDFIYSLLEQEYLQDLKKNHKLKINEFSKEIKSLQEQLSKPDEHINTLNTSINKLIFSIILHILSGISVTCLLAFMLYYCYRSARRDYQKSISVKTYAFLVKFTENIGWVYCVTIVGIIYGIGLVFMGQYFQISHKALESALRNKKSDMGQTVS